MTFRPKPTKPASEYELRTPEGRGWAVPGGAERPLRARAGSILPDRWPRRIFCILCVRVRKVRGPTPHERVSCMGVFALTGPACGPKPRMANSLRSSLIGRRAEWGANAFSMVAGTRSRSACMFTNAWLDRRGVERCVSRRAVGIRFRHRLPGFRPRATRHGLGGRTLVTGSALRAWMAGRQWGPTIQG